MKEQVSRNTVWGKPGVSHLQTSGETNMNEVLYRCLQSKPRYPGLEVYLSKNLNRVESQSPRKDVIKIHKNWNGLSANLFPNREMENC